MITVAKVTTIVPLHDNGLSQLYHQILLAYNAVAFLQYKMRLKEELIIFIMM